MLKPLPGVQFWRQLRFSTEAAQLLQLVQKMVGTNTAFEGNLESSALKNEPFKRSVKAQASSSGTALTLSVGRNFTPELFSLQQADKEVARGRTLT